MGTQYIHFEFPKIIIDKEKFINQFELYTLTITVTDIFYYSKKQAELITVTF